MTMFQRFRIHFLAAALLATAAFAFSCGKHDNSPVIATVNGSNLKRSEFDQFLKFKLGELAGNNTPDPLRSQMLDEFIKRRLVLNAAKSAGLSVSDADVQQAIEDNPQIKPTAADQQARTELMNDLLVSKYDREVVLKDVKVTPDEAQKYLDSHQHPDKPGFYIRELRVDNAQKAAELRQQASEKDSDFAALVRQYSQAPNAEQGGLSYYEEGQLPEVLDKAIKPLGPGEISPVITSSFGYHIFKLERRTQPHAPEEKRAQLDVNRSQLIQDAISRKNQEVVDRAVASLVASASISIKESALGFTYTGGLGHN